ncbi:hypothetical protein OSB04_000315 [Centaurea solstitialis]|uniref:DUF7792 domain-containing protein n=1 Tax=Centaurea solstitialis TaxID=347529 RepID=A0AA38WTS5_9ASTR|nr:hypothetical protein OSB04_000315 [Centaurea solstitialis]
MADIVKQILTRPIQLADQVIKSADEACLNKQDCTELKSKTEKLAGLLRQAARASSDLYERPTSESSTTPNRSSIRHSRWCSNAATTAS